MKQSSIEWLFEQYKLVGMLTTAQVEKAKRIHNEEITNAWDAGYDELDRATASPLKYYEETFNNKEKCTK